MELRDLGPNGQTALDQALGYLNFSAGAEDVQFLGNLNRLVDLIRFAPGAVAEVAVADEPEYRRLLAYLQQRLDELDGKSPAFQDTHQARRVLELLEEHVLPEYLTFHRDLLFHQSDRTIFRPFFLGRVFEAILKHHDAWDDPKRLVDQTLQTLNDYVGYRPVAVLENRALTAYPHERVRPLPLFIQGAGVENGPYRTVVELALEFLKHTDPRILRAAQFHPNHLRELAVDPRAYDFDHPVNKRPNYHFGLWDPQAIDNRGFYYRFVVQEVTLNALMSRISTAAREVERHELEREAAAVLAGTILMASGVSGAAPGAHDSNTTLGNLLPGIAAYRDMFYEHLIGQLMRMDQKHALRLQMEARRLRQPFGAARQHLNAQLTRCRASQLERVRLASVFARMGHPRAAQHQINSVPVASARMTCQVDCNLTMAQRDVEAGRLEEARTLMRESREILQRAIDCGAMIDPWNILGFDGNFSLFPAMENSIHDHRVDELVELVEEMFDTYGQIWSAAAARNDRASSQAVAGELEDFARWWHPFAVHEVSCIDSPNAMELFHATQNVARALESWHQAGEATGNIGFWAPYVEQFDSPKSYSMVITMLLDRADYVAARGLLIHWLGQADTVQLEQGEDSFYHLALRWLVLSLKLPTLMRADAARPTTNATADDWQRTKKFFDYLEANAGHLWRVPTWEGTAADVESDGDEEDEDDDELSEEHLESGFDGEESDEDDELFGAAYEGVVYRDSTDDGMESSVYDTGSGQNDAWDTMHDQILRRLAFHNSLSRLRRVTSIAWMLQEEALRDQVSLQDHLQAWSQHAIGLHDQLEDLLLQVWRQRLTRPSHDYMSLAEFDRERVIKESLMEHIIVACVEAKQSAHFAICALQDESDHVADLSQDEQLAIRLLRAALHSKTDVAHDIWQQLKRTLRGEAILYVPLVRGGNPRAIVSIRTRQQLLRTLLNWMPRLGMLTETRELVDVVRQMERNVPAGPGAVTEFDDLFEMGFRGLVDSIIRAQNVNETVDLAPSEEAKESEPQLVSCLERMTESMLVTWLSHSRTLRLSVLEKVKSNNAWQDLVDFVKRYGADLFTQQFLSLANVRSILYQGVENWLEQLQQQPPPDFQPRLLEELDSHISRDDAAQHMTLILEAVVENYAEYRDYNSTTTQSDRGDLLYNLLDFLRLLSNYERVVWNLKPVVIAHELLVRRSCNVAAQLWRRALSERIAEEADRYQERLTKLQQRYAMRLPTIADRVGERFLRPLIIDRMRALVRPSMEQPEGREFEILEEESILLTREPSGVGFEPPAWLLGLEEEVRRLRRSQTVVDDHQLMDAILPVVRLTIEEVQRQIDSWGPRD